MTDIAFHSASVLCQALRARKVGCVELLEHYLRRIGRHNPAINAVVTIDEEGARLKARQADEALARGESWGPLHGLPMTVKDSIEIAGMRTTSGARALAGHVPDTDAPAVLRLKRAGAVLFGKTNLPPYAGDCQTRNELFGATSNPWDTSRTAGGSSGGAAAAVAAGLTGLELGSDLGGSCRYPAHCCGVYGHKPSHNLVPFRGHIPPRPGSLARHDLWGLGPIARDADDLDLGLTALSGPDDADTAAWSVVLPPPRHRAINDFRIAAWLDGPVPIDGEVRRVLEQCTSALEACGATVQRQARPDIDFKLATEVFTGLVMAEALASQMDVTPPAASSVAAGNTSGPGPSYQQWLSLDEQRSSMRWRWAEFFREYDVLLTPVSGLAAFPHAPGIDIMSLQVLVNGKPERFWDQIFWTGVLGNCFYLPATAAPAGFTRAGLPVGIQIIGPYLEDRTTLRFAKLLADVAGSYVPPPQFA